MQISWLPSLRGVITTFIPFALKVCEGIVLKVCEGIVLKVSEGIALKVWEGEDTALKVWEGEGTALKVWEGKILLKRLMKVLPYSSIVVSSCFENVLLGDCKSG